MCQLLALKAHFISQLETGTFVRTNVRTNAHTQTPAMSLRCPRLGVWLGVCGLAGSAWEIVRPVGLLQRLTQRGAEGGTPSESRPAR